LKACPATRYDIAPLSAALINRDNGACFIVQAALALLPCTVRELILGSVRVSRAVTGDD
jgi:hypothetical protein